jgi:hypothetical protein
MIKLLTAGALLGSQAASPPPVPPAPQCLTRQQIGDVAVVASSIMLDLVRDACRPHLAADAFLVRPAGTEHLARLRAEAGRRFESAARSLPPGFGGEAVTLGTARTQLQTIMALGAAAGGFGTLDAPLCREIDELIETTSPMSADQGARFTTALYSLVLQFEARIARAAAAAAEAEAEAATAARPGDAEGEAAVAQADRPPQPALLPICPE